jgi:hypothetical protein
MQGYGGAVYWIALMAAVVAVCAGPGIGTMLVLSSTRILILKRLCISSPGLAGYVVCRTQCFVSARHRLEAVDFFGWLSSVQWSTSRNFVNYRALGSVRQLGWDRYFTAGISCHTPFLLCAVFSLEQIRIIPGLGFKKDAPANLTSLNQNTKPAVVLITWNLQQMHRLSKVYKELFYDQRLIASHWM